MLDEHNLGLLVSLDLSRVPYMTTVRTILPVNEYIPENGIGITTITIVFLSLFTFDGCRAELSQLDGTGQIVIGYFTTK